MVQANAYPRYVVGHWGQWANLSLLWMEQFILYKFLS